MRSAKAKYLMFGINYKLVKGKVMEIKIPS